MNGQTNRIHWIDTLRAVAIFMMVTVHIYNTWAEESLSSSGSIPLYVYLIGMAPVFFLAVVGMSMFVSLNRRGKSSYHLKRGAWLIVGGFSIGMAVLQPQAFGIFQIIGFSIILIEVLHRFDMTIRGFLIGLILIVLLTLIINFLLPTTSPEYFVSFSTPLAYTRPDLISYSSDNLFIIFIENSLFARVSYPIFPWATFAVLGYILANYLLKDNSNVQRSIVSLGTGIMLVVISIALMIIGVPIYKYPTTINYVLLSSGVFIISTVLVKGLYDSRTSVEQNPLSAVVESTGKYAFEIFILQYYFIAAVGIVIKLQYIELVLAMIGSCFFILIAVAIANVYGNRMLEKVGFYRLTGLTRRHSFKMTILSIILLIIIYLLQNELLLATGKLTFYLITRGSSFLSILLVYWQVMLARRTPLSTPTENVVVQ